MENIERKRWCCYQKLIRTFKWISLRKTNNIDCCPKQNHFLLGISCNKDTFVLFLGFQIIWENLNIVQWNVHFRISLNLSNQIKLLPNRTDKFREDQTVCCVWMKYNMNKKTEKIMWKSEIKIWTIRNIKILNSISKERESENRIERKIYIHIYNYISL